jgi:hypothetical protein
VGRVNQWAKDEYIPLSARKRLATAILRPDED